MTPTIIGNATLYNADCIEVLKALPENSIEACLTDPPYGLSQHSEADIRACMAAWLAGKPYVHGGAGFMGKEWDSFVPGPEMWKELYRVLKPGAHLLVFAGTRTADLMSMALRLAGFECRENLLWCFGSGFPKSANVSKMIDSMKGAEREVVGVNKSAIRNKKRDTTWTGEVWGDNGATITAPATPEAAQWDGWHSALKPSYEPILLFRKPLDGTIAGNTLKWGTGGLNIKACRVGNEVETWPKTRARPEAGYPNALYTHRLAGNPHTQTVSTGEAPQGRYPSTLILDSSEQVEKCFPVTGPSKAAARGGTNPNPMDWGNARADGDIVKGHSDNGGSASRFFQHCDYTLEEIAELNGIEPKRIVYSGKASKQDRNEGCEGMEEKQSVGGGGGIGDYLDDVNSASGKYGSEKAPGRNHHPSVKPCNLLRYLLRLSVPPGATVIDPFLGSGSTAKAALLEGFNVIGIEREPDYFEIACARTAHVSPDAVMVQATNPTKSIKASAPVQAGLFESVA
jgi:DNA modification methylase